MQDFFPLLQDNRNTVVFLDALNTVLDNPLAVFLPGQCLESFLEPADVPLREDESGTSNDGRYFPGIGSAHRRAAGHRLGKNPAKLLFPCWSGL